MKCDECGTLEKRPVQKRAILFVHLWRHWFFIWNEYLSYIYSVTDVVAGFCVSMSVGYSEYSPHTARNGAYTRTFSLCLPCIVWPGFYKNFCFYFYFLSVWTWSLGFLFYVLYCISLAENLLSEISVHLHGIMLDSFLLICSINLLINIGF